MGKFVVNTTITKTQHFDFQFEVEAESQEEAGNKVRELGFNESLNTFKVADENVYDEKFNEEAFEVIGD